MPAHLHVHSVVEIYGRCWSFKTSLPCWWLHFGKVLSLHVRSYSPRLDWWWVMAWSYASRCLTPISLTSYIPINRALYSATLLEHGSVNENAQEITWLCGETSTTPTFATIFPLAPVLDALSKNSCHTFSRGCVGHTNFHDFIWKIVIKFRGSWNWMISQEICHSLAFYSLLWHELHLILGEQYSPLRQSAV